MTKKKLSKAPELPPAPLGVERTFGVHAPVEVDNKKPRDPKTSVVTVNKVVIPEPARPAGGPNPVTPVNTAEEAPVEQPAETPARAKNGRFARIKNTLKRGKGTK